MKQDLRPYELEGLCMTCNHASSCGYLARTEGPIWRCEEFDDSEPATTLSPVTPGSRPLRQPAGPAHTGGGAPRGLCCNCDNHSCCALPGTLEGVWFCEEYR